MENPGRRLHEFSSLQKPQNVPATDAEKGGFNR